ncbi:hypothetical protein PMAC_001462 [Pneumocystis sp. 'macacae']|nr:hypothetical protein PMAC_001462 [Pneumocystis sp. 'macacae']
MGRAAVQLVEAEGAAHGRLDYEGADVLWSEGGGGAETYLPALLEEGDKEVDCEHDVCNELVLGERDIADSDAETEHL